MFPSLFPWVDESPCTEETGREVMKLTGIMYVLIILLDLLLVVDGGVSPVLVNLLCVLLAAAIIYILVVISRKPQVRGV